MMEKHNSFKDFLRDYDSNFPILNLIDQNKLNLETGHATNYFPYQGQFSPELPVNLLSHFAKQGMAFFDPFMGCGTSLLAASRMKMKITGAEVNAMPFLMARTILFTSLTLPQRKKVFEIIFGKLRDFFEPKPGGLAQFGFHSRETSSTLGINNGLQWEFDEKDIITLIKSNELNVLEQNILLISLLKAKKGKNMFPDRFLVELENHLDFVLSLPVNPQTPELFLRDARNTGLPDATVDIVLTSPPYINVKNYHQQHRAIAEELHYDVLVAAKSEMGSNRKFRQNRFQTVIQFTIDISDALCEIWRVLKSSGILIVVIGRVSTVKGIEFRNDKIIAGMGMVSGFNKPKRLERVFKNKFGVDIFEDILVFEKKEKSISPEESMHYARNLARAMLNEALERITPNSENGMLIRDAISSIDSIEPSPYFEIEKGRLKQMGIHGEKILKAQGNKKYQSEEHKEFFQEALERYYKWRETNLNLTEENRDTVFQRIILLNEYYDSLDFDGFVKYIEMQRSLHDIEIGYEYGEDGFSITFLYGVPLKDYNGTICPAEYVFPVRFFVVWRYDYNFHPTQIGSTFRRVQPSEDYTEEFFWLTNWYGEIENE